MAEDKSPAQPLEAPPLAPLKLKPRLARTPRQAPRYAVRVKNLAGQEVLVADPRATRALVALMNVHAVNGGAACLWGGPAAMAEINAALHAQMFAVPDREWYEAFNYVNDAGHTENGVYALRTLYGFDGLTFEDLKGFRSLTSKLTGSRRVAPQPPGRAPEQRPARADGRGVRGLAERASGGDLPHRGVLGFGGLGDVGDADQRLGAGAIPGPGGNQRRAAVLPGGAGAVRKAEGHRHFRCLRALPER